MTQRARLSPVVGGASLFCAVAVLTISAGHAQSPPLSGLVSSAEEPAMEGVLVSAKSIGSTITTTVVTDEKGRYSFPASRLQPGRYQIRIRAVGYNLSSPVEIEVAPGKGASTDLRLVKTKDLAAQLTNAEWLESVPGTPQQKTMLQNCVNCHTVERVMRSKYTSKEFLEAVLPRMQSYVNQSIPEAPQLRKAERLMEERGDQRVQIYKAVGDYLAQVNLSTGPEWSYELTSFRRPKGRATRVVYTEYDLPRKTIQPHDVIVDDKGVAWYSSFGEQFVGRIDPKTGAHKEYPLAVLKPGFPIGALSIRADKEGFFWLGNMYQGALVRFDPRTETLKTWSLPLEMNIDQAQLNMSAPGAMHLDGKIWTQNNGFAGVHRLDLSTGKWETWEPFKNAPKGEPHNIYDVIADSKNNVFFTDFRWHHIGRIDAQTRQVSIFEVPTRGSNPRRGQMDAQDRLWFGEYRGHKIGMLDTRTLQFKEWPVPTPWSAPYDVALDKNEEAWTGSMLTDRVARLNTKTDEIVEYLLPNSTNIRRVFVDNTTSPVMFWVGNNHGASIIKLEPLD
jgi:virginiamycin B lyase